MKIMEELSEIYQLNETHAAMAGLLHDAARDLAPLQLLKLAEEAQLLFSHPCEQHPIYLHARVSAYLACKEFKVTEPLILEAISAHSYIEIGPNSNALLSRCLRAADVLAPIQAWRGMNKLRNLVYGGRIDEAELLQTGWMIEFFGEQDIPVHPDLVKSFHLLSSRLQVMDSFFERW